MRTYVNETEKRYFVNEEKGTVVCLLDIELDLDKALDYDRYEILEDGQIIEVFKKRGFYADEVYHGLFHITVRGKTKVQGDDVFDEEKGKMIALTKAQSAAFNKCYKTLEDVMDVIDRNLTDKIFRTIYGCRIAYENGLKHVAELSNEDNTVEKCSIEIKETND